MAVMAGAIYTLSASSNPDHTDHTQTVLTPSGDECKKLPGSSEAVKTQTDDWA